MVDLSGARTVKHALRHSPELLRGANDSEHARRFKVKHDASAGGSPREAAQTDHAMNIGPAPPDKDLFLARQSPPGDADPFHSAKVPR